MSKIIIGVMVPIELVIHISSNYIEVCWKINILPYLTNKSSYNLFNSIFVDDKWGDIPLIKYGVALTLIE